MNCPSSENSARMQMQRGLAPRQHPGGLRVEEASSLTTRTCQGTSVPQALSCPSQHNLRKVASQRMQWRLREITSLAQGPPGERWWSGASLDREAHFLWTLFSLQPSARRRLPRAAYTPHSLVPVRGSCPAWHQGSSLGDLQSEGLTSHRLFSSVLILPKSVTGGTLYSTYNLPYTCRYVLSES